MHKEKRPVRTGHPTQTRSTRLFRLFLFAIVGDILGIIGIVLSIAKKKEYRTTASLVCSIIGLVLSIVNHVAGALLISYIATQM